MEACSPAIIIKYFDQLNEVLEEYDLMDCPEQISRAQKHSNTTTKPTAPKRARLDEVEHSGSDSTLKPNDAMRVRTAE